MLKKLLLATVYAVSLSAAFEVFAFDKAIKAVSGEIDCFGMRNQIQESAILFRNLNSKKSISFTKITIYGPGGELMQELSPAGFPSDFPHTEPPFASTDLDSAKLLPGQAPGAFTLRIKFESTDGTLAIAPQVTAVTLLYSSTSKSSLVDRTTHECTYISLSNK